MRKLLLFVALICLVTPVCTPVQTKDSLPSWNESAPKKAIIQFVNNVTTVGGSKFVPPAERIAVFDNDGTLWAEQPMYFQLAFALDRVKALAPLHPEWKQKQPFKAVLEGDLKTVLASGEHALLEILLATHAGNTKEEFSQSVKDWLATARHPKTGRPYTDMVYQPMLELLAYLRANGFKTFIVSGGGIEFMRPWVESVYGIPPEQVIGSSIKTEYELRDGKPVLMRLPAINFINDKAGKPVGINQHIGRRPIAAFGNSDGDLQMLQWTTAGSGERFALIVHHTDDAREWAYDRLSSIGHLDKALDEAQAKGWTVVDMKQNWKVIFPFEKQSAQAQPKTTAYKKLIGQWVRPDGGYTLVIKGVAADGKIDAAYLNPKSIRVSKARASTKSGQINIFVELQDVGYPGSYYTLVYDKDTDRLAGVYHQLATKQNFDIFFVRK